MRVGDWVVGVRDHPSILAALKFRDLKVYTHPRLSFRAKKRGLSSRSSSSWTSCRSRILSMRGEVRVRISHGLSIICLLSLLRKEDTPTRNSLQKQSCRSFWFFVFFFGGGGRGGLWWRIKENVRMKEGVSTEKLYNVRRVLSLVQIPNHEIISRKVFFFNR